MTEATKPQVPEPTAEGVSEIKADAQPQSPVTPEKAVTPSQAPVDVDALRTQFERDLNQMKAALQRREAEVNKQWQDKYTTLEQKMHDAVTSKMTADEREEYEASLAGQEFEELQKAHAELQQQLAQQAQTMDGILFFMSRGVPFDKLVVNEGYDAMARSGWAWIDQERKELREQATKLVAAPQDQPKTEPEPLPNAPAVVTDKSIPSTGPTWEDWHKKGWTDEQVYRAVEAGRLSRDAIPKE